MPARHNKLNSVFKKKTAHNILAEFLTRMIVLDQPIPQPSHVLLSERLLPQMPLAPASSSHAPLVAASPPTGGAMVIGTAARTKTAMRGTAPRPPAAVTRYGSTRGKGSHCHVLWDDSMSFAVAWLRENIVTLRDLEHCSVTQELISFKISI